MRAYGGTAVIHLAVTRDPLVGIDPDEDLAAHQTAPARRRGVSLSSRTRIGGSSAAAAATTLTPVLAQNGDAHVGDFQIRRFGIPVDILGIGFQVRKEAKSPSHASAFRNERRPKRSSKTYALLLSIRFLTRVAQCLTVKLDLVPWGRDNYIYTR